MLTRLAIPLLLVPVLACSGTEPETLSPAAPSPAASPTNTRFTLGGQVVTSFTRVPISEATVSVINGLDAGRSTTTDVSGNFSFTDMQQSDVIVDVSAVEFFSTRAPLANGQTQTVFLVPLGPTIQLSGRLIDAGTLAPVAAATVYLNGRYRATTDASGNFSLTGHLDIGDSSFLWTSAEGYETHARYVRGISAQSFRLRRIERIVGGESWSVTVHPDDSLCFNDFQDPSFAVPGSGFLCRTVRVVVRGDGLLKVEAISTQDGSHPPLVVEAPSASLFAEGMENPISVKVRTGTEVFVHVEIPERSTTSQSFIVTTSMSP